jgi:hypothetical protein
VAPVASSNAQVVYGSGNTQTNIYGTTASYLEVRNTSLSNGRFFTEQEINDYKRVAVLDRPSWRLSWIPIPPIQVLSENRQNQQHTVPGYRHHGKPGFFRVFQ